MLVSKATSDLEVLLGHKTTSASSLDTVFWAVPGDIRHKHFHDFEREKHGKVSVFNRFCFAVPLVRTLFPSMPSMAKAAKTKIMNLLGRLKSRSVVILSTHRSACFDIAIGLLVWIGRFFSTTLGVEVRRNFEKIG